ncbi:sn-glycerol-3-phosphate ABC transporter ATP-binding protein UgpC [Acidovorax sp.]|uniref:ABC transporter ATP-binding protein n=1 Tax=Acidovorax sp. TaxID=1872122 RepID=UPI002636499F|nr:sn-glycerol-3-phosphate ABC transporter ATP-binding protein UgpC [Acidovorax sp.]
MAQVSLQQISKRFGDSTVLHGVDLQIADGEFVVLVGPSGCGKSTLLRMLCGLEEISGGDMLIDGQKVNHLPPAQRGIAMVFQSYALYPHMTVKENMGFGLKIRGADRSERDQRVLDAAKALHIDHLLERLPRELSGGQRQRVAIGRAIVRKPKLFLFDEPLSNLDAALRGKTRLELARLHRELAATMVYVTHDQVEAMTLGDRIVVMNEGRVQQAGTPLELYTQPANRFVATFIGSPTMNLLPAQVTGLLEGGASLNLGADHAAAACVDSKGLAAGEAVEVGIRPEHLTLIPAHQEVHPHQGVAFLAEVAAVEQLGESHLLYARTVQGQDLVLRGNAHTRLRGGDAVRMFAPAHALHVFNSKGRAHPRLVIEGHLGH